MSWYANWFDTTYYHTLYKHRDEQEAFAFVDQLSEKFTPEKYPYLCDAACGKGRHALRFFEQGFKVDAFDLSEQSIQFAKNLEKEGLHFFEHDITQPFATQKYNMVTNLFTSFGYFDTEISDLQALSAIVESLKSDGVFVQDFLNANLVQADRQWNKKEMNGITFRTKKTVEDGFVRKAIEVIDRGEIHTYNEQVRLFSLKDFERLYQMVGLEITDVYGDYKLSKFDPLESPRLILVSKPKS